MDQETIKAIVFAILGSSGLWACILFLFQWLRDRYNLKHSTRTAEANMLRGLGHDRIIYLCSKYIEKGFITADEYEDLNEYLYKPYRELGGNGTAEKLMKEVNNLPVHKK